MFDDGKIMGDLFGLYINGLPIACETSCDLSTNMDMKGISPVNAGGWQEFIPGVRSWTVNVSGNFITHFAQADYKTLMTAFLNRQSVQVAIRTADGYSPSVFLGGTAYPMGSNLSSSVRQNVGYTWSFQGTGPLSFTAEASEGDFWRILNANPIGADKPIYIQSTL